MKMIIEFSFFFLKSCISLTDKFNLKCIFIDNRYRPTKENKVSLDRLVKHRMYERKLVFRGASPTDPDFFWIFDISRLPMLLLFCVIDGCHK